MMVSSLEPIINERVDVERVSFLEQLIFGQIYLLRLFVYVRETEV